jgi:DNA helicase-2/ATP-dependent DNA helicase PcrA
MKGLSATSMATKPSLMLYSLANMLRRDLFELGAIPKSRAMRSLSSWATMNGVTDQDANQAAQTVTEALVLCGDISTGNSFGEALLLKKERELVMIDADRVIILGGDPSVGEAHGLLRLLEYSEDSASNLKDMLQPLDEEGIRGLRQLLETRFWDQSKVVPPDLARALYCLGLGEEANISDEIADAVVDLFPHARDPEERGLDTGQETVVGNPAEARVVVTAGPGCGKTHTACARVVELIRRGVPPAGIVLITFTRVAAEVANTRVSKVIQDTAYGAGVLCGTLDSFAWHFSSSVLDLQGATHRDTIRRTSRLLKDMDVPVRDRLMRIRHLIIDESQDIVGDRMKLCLDLIGALSPTAGVTVFGDWAQAIYGSWAEGEVKDQAKGTNLHQALGGLAGWSKAELAVNHRTRSPVLRDLFIAARNTLGERNLDERERYLRIRSQVEDAATNLSVDLLGSIMPWREGNLVLFRNRAGADAGSGRLAAAGKSHKLKLSGRTTVVDPLPGILCAGLSRGMTVSGEHIRARLAELVPTPLEVDADEGHAMLSQLAGTAKANPVITQIAEGIEREPIWITSDHIGTSGPLLGSIHGAKGQEADTVLLMMPPVPTGDKVDWAEEAKVLFVAATRASRHLYLGNARPIFSTTRRDGTRWLRGGGGLSLAGTEGLSPLADLETAYNIWTAAFAHPLCSFARNAKTDKWRVVLENGSQLAGANSYLSEALDYLSANQNELPFGHLRIVGATSVAVRRPDGGVSGVTLLPVLQGVVNGHNVKEQQ